MVIDIRSFSDYQKGHLMGAIHIPPTELYREPEKYLRKEVCYTFYCESGNTSFLLVEYLRSLGYQCVNLEGGYSKNVFK